MSGSPAKLPRCDVGPPAKPARPLRHRHAAVVGASIWALLMACGLLALATPAPGVAEEAARSLRWADLVPPPKATAQPGIPRSFLANRPKETPPPPGGIGSIPGAVHNPQVAEGKWLTPGALAQPGAGSPPELVENLDGQRVTIGGYIVPLDFDATKVKEFLLVPFVGACIHVPPPPANQLVYVRHESGVEVKATFDPVWVTGRMRAKVAFTGLAEAGYSIEAEKVETRKE